MKVWTEIAAERLVGNFRALSAILGEDADEGEAPALLAVVKANAYGHGIDACAGILAGAGAEWLGVTDAHEGARVRAALRAAGIAEAEDSTFESQDVGRLGVLRPTHREGQERDGWGTREVVGSEGPISQSRDVGRLGGLHPTHREGQERDGWGTQSFGGSQPKILVMSGTMGLEGEAECVVANHLTAVVWEREHVKRLGAAALRQGSESPVRVHLEVDTGMSRQGASPGAELDQVLRAIADEPGVMLDGVFTHFASTEIAGSEQTAMQQAAFEAAVAQVAGCGMRPAWVHVGNSSYIDNAAAGIANTAADPVRWLGPVARRVGARAMVRSGLALYGYLLPIEGAGESRARAKVLPVMAWKTRVIGVRDVPAGALVGYDGAYVAERPMRLALLPLGYADGLRRELSSTNARAGGWVVIRGERTPVVGRVSMNLTTVDVSGIPGVGTGDEVTVLGDGVNADDHARIAGTIAYEILCGVKTAE